MNTSLRNARPDTAFYQPATRKGGFSDYQIRDNVVACIGAGYETTSLTLCWALCHLAHHPDWQDRLVAARQAACNGRRLGPPDIDVLINHEMVIYEAMRFAPPAPSHYRSATKNNQMGAMRVAKVDVVVVPD